MGRPRLLPPFHPAAQLRFGCRQRHVKVIAPDYIRMNRPIERLRQSSRLLELSVVTTLLPDSIVSDDRATRRWLWNLISRFGFDVDFPRDTKAVSNHAIPRGERRFRERYHDFSIETES